MQHDPDEKPMNSHAKKQIEEDKVREEIEHEGIALDRMFFIAEAAVRFAAAIEADGDSGFNMEHRPRAEWAFDAAETLWDEACKRFGD